VINKFYARTHNTTYKRTKGSFQAKKKEKKERKRKQAERKKKI